MNLNPQEVYSLPVDGVQGLGYPARVATTGKIFWKHVVLVHYLLTDKHIVHLFNHCLLVGT